MFGVFVFDIGTFVNGRMVVGNSTESLIVRLNLRLDFIELKMLNMAMVNK